MHLGIDYGSKLAGTTAICYQRKKELVVIQSGKKQDADLFIQGIVEELKPNEIFIDAPLSLPAAYFGKGDDYFYRACDRELNAMSPMFLGGLTARAIKLIKPFQDNGIACYESYPTALVKDLNKLQGIYDKKSKVNTAVITRLEEIVDMQIKFISNYHQIDAVLCWYSGMRNLLGVARVVGEEEEGQIIY